MRTSPKKMTANRIGGGTEAGVAAVMIPTADDCNTVRKVGVGRMSSPGRHKRRNGFWSGFKRGITLVQLELDGSGPPEAEKSKGTRRFGEITYVAIYAGVSMVVLLTILLGLIWGLVSAIRWLIGLF